MKKKYSIVPSIALIIVLLFVIYIHKTYFPGKHSSYSNFTTRLGATSSNFSNTWHYEFQYLDGSVQGFFTAKNDHSKLIYSSNIEEGTIAYHLYEGSDNHFVNLPVGNSFDSLTGVFEKGRNYEIRAIASKAKGSFDFKME